MAKNKNISFKEELKVEFEKYINDDKSKLSKCRKFLLEAFINSNECYCNGKIISIKGTKILFKNLFISYGFENKYIDGKENHIWIDFNDIDKEIEDININDLKKGMNISFSGEVYPYKRLKNNTIDFSINNIIDFKIIDSYQLPSNRDLQYQSLQEMECITCMYNEHCYGNCLKAQRLFSEENKNKNIKEVIISIHNDNSYRENDYDKIYSFKLHQDSIKRYVINEKTFQYIPDNNDDEPMFTKPIKYLLIEEVFPLINLLLMENETISSYLAFLSENESNDKNIKDSIFHNYYDFRNKINNLK